jgi:hypothetical protein
MKQYSDIVAFDRSGELALLVEVKNKRGTTPEWAAKMRRNMYAHGLLPKAPFFLLALPDRFYFWRNASPTEELAEPTLQVDSSPFLQPYFEKAGVSSEDVTGKSFELIVTAWLSHVLGADGPEDLRDRNQEWVLTSGLFNSLAGGRLELEAAA